ncbi:tyrosine-protein phosphatase [Jeotgalibacillus haloalkalitolerans]|uniref:Tyrosine-protein phosphatase n=1 Tax=Jeotgalibacillus haloalkalitolerans TaxID=3104292 RepID=A0ABU5KJ88_9BACL|nr:CpsB/CapC family capsule biosynthesis tyrosine phosphatase [Jeotgalibacillus sp. HH7-29]MDZ5711306.1 CpsB/CapC family capsule biosynthesis tyrosine phosphatase [Jeotgalibacillus sp. HH7-29]
MIDIHCHILPGLDDGAQTIEDALTMADQAIENGITDIIATPHHQTRRFHNESHIVKRAVHELNRKLAETGRSLKIHPGQEIRMYGELIEDLRSGTSIALGKNQNPYVLVEFPSSQIPVFAQRVLYDLQVEGYRPIIAHPERNSMIVEKPERLLELVQQGVLTQLTATSVAGEFNKKVQKFSLQLIESNQAHFIASDAHNTGARGFSMQKAYQVITDRFGSQVTSEMKEHSTSVLSGELFVPAPPELIRKQSFLRRILPI